MGVKIMFIIVSNNSLDYCGKNNLLPVKSRFVFWYCLATRVHSTESKLL